MTWKEIIGDLNMSACMHGCKSAHVDMHAWMQGCTCMHARVYLDYIDSRKEVLDLLDDLELGLVIKHK
jgi:hypothetical protein